MTRKIVAVISPIGGGKDTIMNRLQSRLVYKHGYAMSRTSTIRCRFADALNEAIAPILGISGRELQDRELKEKPRFIFENPKKIEAKVWSSRDVQKEVGGLLREYLGIDVFINALDRKYPNGILLISDLRMRNELDWVREQGGKIVYIYNEAAAKTQKERESKTTKLRINVSETRQPIWTSSERVDHLPPESELLQWDFYNKVETPDYWLDNNDFDNHSYFDDFVDFVLDYLEQ